MMRFQVNGMTCDGCARAVTRAIQGAEGKAAVSVDLAGGTVSVEGPAALAPETVSRAIEAAGFEVAGRIA